MSSYSRPLYFAYGSNFSHTQMKSRCTHNPEQSGRPVAIAYLPNWTWLINQRRYATIMPDGGFGTAPKSYRGSGVYGVLYEMTEEDEKLLDGYEDVDVNRRPAELSVWPDDVRPTEQGSGDYNKWYLDVRVIKKIYGEPKDVERVLVYVDELMVEPGEPYEEYIGRMNRGIRESVQLGLPQEWVDEVVRKYIPAKE
ncbi:hypothetical protein CYLTODRAFT_420055 [Cylindrobasidium torrendii FP15055 ss-10]|uniref:gamma-glutamylcyclotransferase n=1 Tax=Cylindrobasidium torrendii FP15055 ss-10 TaxID=1314674 RepID=A0A0D7BHW7_9AGAR|nr:hypothetical protein CYLTODRAFT_420055 [Cylindrobasidium torrendii FP15055 ss-10]